MKPETEKKLLAKDNVVGVGKGKKRTRGRNTGQDAIIVLVKKKLPLDEVKDPVPPTIDGVITDVIEVGEIVATNWANIEPRETVARMRPALGGCSVGHYAITAGTLGVVASYQGKKVIFSNNHVLANSNAGRRGEAILQPGRYDGGSLDKDSIGVLEAFVPVKFDGSPNDADAAFATADQADLALGIMGASEDEVIIPTGFHQFEAGEEGWKRGRTTDYTKLNCLATDVTVRVGYGAGKTATFRGCDVFDPPGASAGGDSGSIIMFGDKMGSHLFAGSDEVTVGEPVEKAFDLLGLTIAEPGPDEPPEEPDEPPVPEPPTGPIEPVELLAIYLDGKVQLKATISVEDGKIVVK